MSKALVPPADEAMRFMFDNHAVRGVIAGLDDEAACLFAGHNYPAPVKAVLLELAITAAMLAVSLKSAGDLMVQIRAGTGAKMKYALININQDLFFYGSASLTDNALFNDDDTLTTLTGTDAVLVISIFPKEGSRWQGIVPLKSSIAKSLEEYFAKSEQLPSRFFIVTDPDNKKAGGIMLQIISGSDNNEASLEHLGILTATVTSPELLSLGKLEILKRLYAGEQVRIFEPVPLKFRCICSKERCENSLLSLPKEELLKLCADKDGTTLNCGHCGKSYHFSAEDLNLLMLKASQ